MKTEKFTEYGVLFIDVDDIIERDMNKGIIKIDKSVFDDFVENAVVYIYCKELDIDVMEFVMLSEDSDSITMEYLGSFSV